MNAMPKCLPGRKGHNWIIKGDTKRKFPAHTYQGNLYRECNFCNYRDPDFQPCEAEVAKHSGNATDWSNCANRAIVQDPGHWFNEGLVWHCGVHSDARRNVRQEKWAAEYREKRAAEDRRWKRERQGRELLPLAEELVQFIDANPDLLEDEWLGKIIRQIRDVLA